MGRITFAARVYDAGPANNNRAARIEKTQCGLYLCDAQHIGSRNFVDVSITCDAHNRRQVGNGVLCAVTDKSIVLLLGSQPGENP